MGQIMLLFPLCYIPSTEGSCGMHDPVLVSCQYYIDWVDKITTKAVCINLTNRVFQPGIENVIIATLVVLTGLSLITHHLFMWRQFRSMCHFLPSSPNCHLCVYNSMCVTYHCIASEANGQLQSWQKKCGEVVGSTNIATTWPFSTAFHHFNVV